MSDVVKIGSGTYDISTGVIAAGESYTTEAISARGLAGYFSLQWLTTGDGTMKAEVLVSNDGVTFFDLDTDICSGQTKSSGTSGASMSKFELTVCDQFKIKFTETGSSDSITIVAKLKAA